MSRAGVATAAMLALGLAGCGTMTEQSAATAFAAPGRYDVYSCQDIDRMAKALHLRKAELEQLMDRTAQGSAGTFVNTIAYRSEYLQTRGSLEELSKAANDKQCSTESKWSSGRAVF